MRPSTALLLALVAAAALGAGDALLPRSAVAADSSAVVADGPERDATHGRARGIPSALSRTHERPVTRRAAPAIPERAAASGTCTVTGAVLDYLGTPVGGTIIELSYRDATGRYTGYTRQTTSASGAFSFTNVPITAGGRLWTWRPGEEYRRHNLVFGSGTNFFTLRPGQVAVQASRSVDPSWSDWDALWVECYGSAGTADREVAGTTGYAYAMEPSFDYAVVHFWDNEAAEGQTLANPVPVTAGEIAPRSIATDEDLAQRVWVDSPFWASGPPNARITLELERWPSGFKAKFWGEMDDPQARWLDYSLEWTSTGQPGHVTLTVPSWATPGYAFLPHAWRSDDLWEFTALDIHDFYQVCTLKPSASSVRAGARVTFGGVIPTQGHWGTQFGLAKTVTLYSRPGSAKTPTKWEPGSQGWKKVASIRADGLGRYKSPAVRMDRTRTFVVRYPGDDWYWGAYTGVARVAVR